MGIGDKKGPFYRLPNEKFIYKWTPKEYDPKTKLIGKSNKKVLCTAEPGSQGEDFITTYVYKLSYIPNNVEHKYAYVECDYVE
jgi:hypothetical protein